MYSCCILKEIFPNWLGMIIKFIVLSCAGPDHGGS
jgi:hypothetical protein